MKSKVSIALCTYNGAIFLRAQLESYLAQTRPPDELVVCDDNSRDETVEILRKFARRAPFAVKIHVNEKNLGTVKNFEKAIGLCGGDLIFLSDQDDVWLPQKIARFCEEFAARPAVSLIFSNAELTDENLAPLGADLWSFTFPERRQIRPQTDDFFEKLLSGNAVTGATAAFRGGLRELVLPIPSELAPMIHDGWIALVAAANGEVFFLDEPLVKYRQHAAQQIGVVQLNEAASKTDYENSIATHKQHLEWLKKLRIFLLDSPVFKKKRHGAALVDRQIADEAEIIRHYQMRATIAPDKLKRILPILRELASGRYRRFSKGLASAAKDFWRE